jgi:hypothetical protein
MFCFDIFLKKFVFCHPSNCIDPGHVSPLTARNHSVEKETPPNMYFAQTSQLLQNSLAIYIFMLFSLVFPIPVISKPFFRYLGLSIQVLVGTGCTASSFSRCGCSASTASSVSRPHYILYTFYCIFSSNCPLFRGKD